LDAASALVDASDTTTECGTQPQKKHNWRSYKVGYNPVNFLSPNEMVRSWLSVRVANNPGAIGSTAQL
jgi:hypothetical protein